MPNRSRTSRWIAVGESSAASRRMMYARCSSLSLGSTRRPRLLIAGGCSGCRSRGLALHGLRSVAAIERRRAFRRRRAFGAMRLDVLEQRAPDLGDSGMVADLQPLDERQQRAQAVLVGDLARIGREVLRLGQDAVEDAVGQDLDRAQHQPLDLPAPGGLVGMARRHAPCARCRTGRPTACRTPRCASDRSSRSRRG